MGTYYLLSCLEFSDLSLEEGSDLSQGENVSFPGGAPGAKMQDRRSLLDLGPHGGGCRAGGEAGLNHLGGVVPSPLLGLNIPGSQVFGWNRNLVHPGDS